MTETGYCGHNCAEARFGIPFAFVVLVLLLFLAIPLHAAEPVHVVVTGIEGDALKNVQETLIMPAGLFPGGTTDRLVLERFADRTRKALEPFGYYNAQVTAAVEPAEEGYRLLVQVAPGEPVRLTLVMVNLIGPGSEDRLLLGLTAAFPLHKGDVLLHQSYEEAKEALKSHARDFGYLDAEFSRHEVRIPQSATTATIDLRLDTGEKYYFGATSIQGAPEYPGQFLRRHLTYTPGDLFSYPGLGETQRNFTNSERFTEVIITPGKELAEGFKVPVTVQLKPGPRISLRPGMGYGTDTGARFTVLYRDLNMFHLGHELYSNLYLAERLQGLVTGYIVPSPRDVRSSTTLQLNLQREDTETYSSRILALELDRNRSFGPSKLGTAYIKAQHEDYTIGDTTSSSRLLLPGFRFSQNGFDNMIRPRRGFRYAVDLRGTHQFLGSDTALVQLIADGSYLVPLPWRLSLHTRGRAGATILSDPLSDLPPSLRLFAGGDRSVRGYSYQSLGPRDISGKVVGGKQLLTFSIELERELTRNWGISLFYDAGNTFNSFSSVSLYQGAGVGLHYYTPVGALNLSVARPLEMDNPSIHTHFTVGFEL